MPLYEYRCRDCGAVTETLVMSARRTDDLTCRTCGGRSLERLPSSPASVSVRERAPAGRTCCGKDERCDTPPCSSGGSCRRD
jgi:putative FmdB family regulatory protein